MEREAFSATTRLNGSARHSNEGPIVFESESLQNACEFHHRSLHAHETPKKRGLRFCIELKNDDRRIPAG